MPPPPLSDSEWEGEESIAGEDGQDKSGQNPVGEYYGGRNDRKERHGRGRAEMPNGDLYLGCYFRGKRHGLGVYRYKNGNGARYGGDFNLGVKAGWGTMYFPDGSQYTGGWSQDRIHGWGVYVYPNGDEYEGWWYMGQKNGRGIYRTKRTGEKFVGNWVLGLRQGKGMIVRKEHRFIGNWYNDCPRGPGVYIFTDLGVEQHGLYTMVKLNSESIPKYKALGYQVMTIRKEPPPTNPLELETDTRVALKNENANGEDGAGEASGDSGEMTPAPTKKKPFSVMDKTPEQEFDEKLGNRMFALIESELATEVSNQMPVTPMWRVIQITGLMTPWLDENVPPPPIPESPKPLLEGVDEFDLEKAAQEEKTCLDNENEEALSLLAAREHVLGDPYTGSGTCQLNLSNIAWPDDCPPALRCSQMSFSNLDDLKNIVQSVLDKPLEPLDFEKIVAQNLHLFKGQGMNISDRWKECLENETDCAKTDLKGAPLPPEKQKESSLPGGAAPRPQQTSAAEREEADLTTPGEELLSTAYDPDEEEEEEEEE